MKRIVKFMHPFVRRILAEPYSIETDELKNNLKIQIKRLLTGSELTELSGANKFNIFTVYLIK